jgi:hypothetical protein
VLGRVVDTAALADLTPGHRADVDQIGDPPGTILGGPQQVRQGRTRAVEEPEQVHLDHPLPVLERRVDQRAEQHHPGAVDQRVQPSQRLDGALNRILGLALVAHVGLQRDRRHALAADPVDERVQPVGATRHHCDPGASLGQRERRRLTDTARRVGHQRDRPVELLGYHPGLTRLQATVPVLLQQRRPTRSATALWS